MNGNDVLFEGLVTRCAILNQKVDLIPGGCDPIKLKHIPPLLAGSPAPMGPTSSMRGHGPILPLFDVLVAPGTNAGAKWDIRVFTKAVITH
jgi:hypothetical protein